MEDSLSVLYDNSQAEEFDERKFKSLLYGELKQNPGADVFYDVRPSTEARKAEVEAYMAEALEEGIIYGGLGDYNDEVLVHTADVLSQSDIYAGAFNAGPVDPSTRELDDVEEHDQNIPEDIPEDFRRGTSLQQQAKSDEDFVDYVLENAVNLGDTLVIKDSPTSIVQKLEDNHVRVHRVNDQPLTTKELSKMAEIDKKF